MRLRLRYQAAGAFSDIGQEVERRFAELHLVLAAQGFGWQKPPGSFQRMPNRFLKDGNLTHGLGVKLASRIEGAGMIG